MIWLWLAFLAFVFFVRNYTVDLAALLEEVHHVLDGFVESRDLVPFIDVFLPFDLSDVFCNSLNTFGLLLFSFLI